MSGNKYNSSVSVNWGNVMKLFKVRINQLKLDAVYYFDCYNKHLIHNYPNLLDYDRFHSIDYVNQIMGLVDELNILRSFLRYKSYSYCDFIPEDVLSFYYEQKDNVKPEHCRIPETFKVS